jgi:hypothetical protein
MTDARLPLWMMVGRDKESINEVVTHVSRVRSRARKALAADNLTIAYLDAGRRLFEQQVTGSIEVGEEDAAQHPFFRWMTRELLFVEVRRGPSPLPKRPTEGSYRDRWKSKADYIDDLIAYLYWTHHWALHEKLATEATSLLLDPDTPFAAAIDEIAYQDTELTLSSDYAGTFRAQITLQPLASRDEAVRIGMRRLYADALATWSNTYQQLLDGRGMHLRPDVTVDDLAIILTAVAEGLAARAIVDGTERVLNPAERKSLLGTAGLAILWAMVDHGDGMTLRHVVNNFGDRFTPIHPKTTPTNE